MVADKDKNLFEENLPADGTLLISNEVRTNFQALDRANELRPVLGSTPNLPIGGTNLNLYILPGNYASDGQSTKTWVGGFTPDYGTAGWPMIVTYLNNRIDAIVINTSGNLMVVTGTEVPGTPLPPTYPSDTIPIAEILLQRVDLLPDPGITNLDDVNIILRDVRPMFVISAAGFGINPKEEVLTATAGQTLFTLTTFVFTVGEKEINVYVGGNRKAITDDYTEVGAPGTASSQILFNTGLPLNEKVLVYKVGAASAHRLSDLDDMTVDLANAVIDPDGIRTVPYVGPAFAHDAFLADHNNPFVTLADLKYGAGLIPFGTEHNSITGTHGPKVTIAQTNDDNALVVTRSHIGGTGIAAVVINNSGAVPGLSVIQSGSDNGILVEQIGNDNAIQILHQHTNSNISPLLISRVVTDPVREPLIALRNNVIGGVGANISVSSTSTLSRELTFADEINVRRFSFDVGTASMVIQNGSDNNHLTILKSSTGGGRSIEVSHTGTDNAVRINYLGTNAALTIYNTGSNSIQVIKGVSTFSLDALWVGPSSNADTYHTHLPGGLNFGTGIALVELNDIDANLSDAVRDVSTLRSSPATAANPLATINDVDTRTAITKSGTYTGNGAAGQTIVLGFQPDWVQVYNNSDNTQSGVYYARGGGTGRFFRTAGSANISIVANGFHLSDGSAPLNKSPDSYYYIAFKSTP